MSIRELPRSGVMRCNNRCFVVSYPAVEAKRAVAQPRPDRWVEAKIGKLLKHRFLRN
jgi:hypothetical protein